MKPYISVVMPAFNEVERIEKTLTPLLELEDISEIIVVDDGSTDQTPLVVSKLPKVKLISLGQNYGKGKALAIGTEEAIKHGDIIVFLDADLMESSREAHKLILPLVKGEAEVTIAKFPPSQKKGGFGLVKLLIFLGQKIHTGKSISSALSGQRAMKKEVLQSINLLDSGYGIELAMTIDLLKKGFQLKEIPVEMTHHETGRDLAGFKHRGKQFVQIFKVIIKKSFH